MSQKDPVTELIAPILAGLGALAIGFLAFVNNKPANTTYSQPSTSSPPPKPCGCSAKK